MKKKYTYTINFNSGLGIYQLISLSVLIQDVFLIALSETQLKETQQHSVQECRNKCIYNKLFIYK